MPGAISGRDTLRNVRQREARMVWLASSIDGLTPSTTPIRTRKAIDVKDSICAIQMPVSPYSQRPSSHPVMSSMNSVTKPARPSMSVSARPMTKGGVMIGRTVSRRSPFLKGRRIRVATSAKARPSKVVPVAVQIARKKVRHATPQPPAPIRQPRLQILGSPILRATPSVVNEPSKS